MKAAFERRFHGICKIGAGARKELTTCSDIARRVDAFFAMDKPTDRNSIIDNSVSEHTD